jgi:hypothetical protein
VAQPWWGRRSHFTAPTRADALRYVCSAAAYRTNSKGGDPHIMVRKGNHFEHGLRSSRPSHTCEGFLSADARMVRRVAPSDFRAFGVTDVFVVVSEPIVPEENSMLSPLLHFIIELQPDFYIAHCPRTCPCELLDPSRVSLFRRGWNFRPHVHSPRDASI